MKEKFRFTAKDLSFHYGIHEKTAQLWSKPNHGRHKIYKALQNQMLIELGEIAKGGK